MKKQEFPPELQAQFTNELLEAFAVNLDKALRERLAKISPRVPGQTIRNLRYEIIKAKGAEITAGFKLHFQDSGRISEMRNVTYTKQRPVDVIADWVKKNRSQFPKVPGYTDGAPKLTEQQKVSRIAWAIVRSQSKTVIRRGRKKKERTWLNPTFYGFFNRLVGDFITEQGEYFQNAIRSGMEGAKEISG